MNRGIKLEVRGRSATRSSIPTPRRTPLRVSSIVRRATEVDDYRKLLLTYDDGREYTSSACADPSGRGGHWAEEPGMIVVHDLSHREVLAAVVAILRNGARDRGFQVKKAPNSASS